MDGVEVREDAPASRSDPATMAAVRAANLPSLCPYLATTDGTWRSATAVREHRCVAVSPPVPLALEKQRRLCLVVEHESCATFAAAEAARPSYALAATPHGRVIARTTPVILDQTRFDLRLPAFRLDRLSGQGLLVGLLLVAFAAILIGRSAGNGGSLNGDTNRTLPPSAPAVASASPHPSPRASAAPVVTARPIGSSEPAPSALASNPPPSAQPTLSGATYTVKRGDTLSSIAARSGTTVKVLVALNHISDPSKIHAGQVLKLP